MVKKVKFDSIRKIQNIKNKQFLKTYFEKIFNDQSIIVNNEEIITEYTFFSLLQVSHYISNKILTILIPSKKITKTNFINAFHLLYNGTLKDIQTLVFKILDYDNDGFIVPDEARLVLRLILPEAEEQELKDIITQFFEGKPDTMSQKNYFHILEKFNSDVFYTIINYIYLNAIFEEKNLDVFNIHIDDSKSERNSKYASVSNIEVEEKLMCPTKGLERVLSILKDDRDLEELEQIETDIKLKKLDIKTIFNLDSPVYEIMAAKTSRVDNKTSDLFKLSNDEYDYEDYIFIKENEDDIKLKKYWGVLINKDLLIFDSNIKLHVHSYHNMTNKFVGRDINKEFYFDKSYYSFSLISRKEKKIFYVDSVSKAKRWTEMIRKSSKQRDFLNYYKLYKLIGEGYAAKVYEAENLINKDIVAVKIFEKEAKTDDDLYVIKEEIEIIKHCMHENIIRYIDDFEDDKNIYVVQEYMNNFDLFNFITNYDLEENDIETIIYQIFSGLNYLRINNIIHRDIKLTNVLIDVKKTINVKISDFGLAKILRANEFRYDRVGMVLFSAPEMLMDKKYSYAVDVWSAGIILYYMLFEKLPFDNELDDEIIVFRNLTNKNYKMLDNTLDYSRFKKLIYGCLEWDDNVRFSIEYIVKNFKNLVKI